MNHLEYGEGALLVCENRIDEFVTAEVHALPTEEELVPPTPQEVEKQKEDKAYHARREARNDCIVAAIIGRRGGNLIVSGIVSLPDKKSGWASR